MLFSHNKFGTFSLVVTATLDGINYTCHLLVLIGERITSKFELPHESLQVESVTVGWISAFGYTHELFNLIHLLE